MPTTGNAGTEEVRVLRDELAALYDLVKEQQLNIAQMQQDAQRTANMHASNNSSERTSPSPLQNLKAPIPAFSGKKEERTSVKVKCFFYNVRKVGALSNMSDSKLLALA